MKYAAAALVLALAAAAGPGLAQTPPAASPPASDSSASPAASARYSIDTKFSVLFADPNAGPLVREFFRKRRLAAGEAAQTPDEEAQSAQLIADMTPREVSQYPQAHLDDAALAELDAELAKVPFPASGPAAAPKA
jgi:hypothetical protein